MKTRNNIVAPIESPSAFLLQLLTLQGIPSAVYLPLRGGWAEYSPSLEDMCMHRATREAAEEPPNDIQLLRGCPNEVQVWQRSKLILTPNHNSRFSK